MKTDKLSWFLRDIANAAAIVVVGKGLPGMNTWIEDYTMSQQQDEFYGDHYHNPADGPYRPMVKPDGACHLEYLAFKEMMKYRFKAATCEVMGHDFEDNSYGGPESGCVDLSCKRCGFNHHVTLY